MVAGRVTADQAAMSVADAVTGAAPVVRMFITVEVVAMTICKCKCKLYYYNFS